MLLAALTSVLIVIGAASSAQTVSDRALEECQAPGQRFTSVKNCLPETDVALNMLDAVQSDKFYGPSGTELVSACEELNNGSVGAWTCAKNAISDAVELLEMVGDAEKISDTLFKGLTSKETFENLITYQKKEQTRFDRMVWGGNTYQPLK